MDLRKATHLGSLYVVICFNVLGLHGIQYRNDIVEDLIFDSGLTVAIHLCLSCIPQCRELFHDVVFLDVLHVPPSRTKAKRCERENYQRQSTACSSVEKMM